MAKNLYYFQLPVTQNQLDFAKELVQYSIRNHPIANIWDKYPDKTEKTFAYRLTGTLGEIVFADAYALPRPTKSFGAIDGQDWGMDFEIESWGVPQRIDVKSMQRKSGVFYENYVLNIPASQLHKPNSLTNAYFCISFHTKSPTQIIASFLGLIQKNEIESGEIGMLYAQGTTRKRADNSTFQFNEATYEVEFKDISSPYLMDEIKQMTGFQILKLRNRA